jgi:hypothetical protein
MPSWIQLAAEAGDLADAGRKLLMNCAATWGIALLGTTRADGSPRIGPLCVYILDDRVYITVEGWKERDLSRDPRYFLHSYWGAGQDEFALAGEVEPALVGEVRDRIIELEPRTRHSPVIRELHITSAHAVTYRNFPKPDMYAEVIAWREGEETRRWTRADPAPPEDSATNS